MGRKGRTVMGELTSLDMLFIGLLSKRGQMSGKKKRGTLAWYCT